MDNIVPNTPEWLEFRRDKVGASDAPIIMGVSPWATPFQLWQKKLMLVPEEEENFAQAHGNRNEPIALEAFEAETGYLMMKCVKVHRKYPWMMASLDAMEITGKCIVEIKCPGEEDHQIACKNKVPEKYFPQLQHQMEVCELEKAYYYSFYEGKGVIVEVNRNDVYIENMIENEKRFIQYVNQFTPPPLLPRDYREVKDEKWFKLAEEWKDVSSQISELERKEKLLKDQLVSMTAGQNSFGGGVRLSKLVRKGNVDYSEIPELKKIDLDSYRKPPIEYWKIVSN